MLALHPKKVAAARDRFRVSGGKSDHFDAFVLCELARTDSHRFRVLEPDSDQTKALRAMTRAREDLVHTRTAVVNQLRAELERCWPGPLRLFSHMDSEILLAFLERYPSPVDARGLGIGRMEAFLRRERYSGRQKPAALLAKLRSAPQGRVGELELAARRQLVLTYVAMVRTLNGQIKGLERDIRTAVRAHPDGPVFLSLFKQAHSVITAAELLAEIGDCRARYPNRDALAADAGQSAVAKESGKRKTAQFRWGCNKRLRVAFCRLADSTRHWHPWARALYGQARQRGLEHPRAIRTLGRAWCRIVWQCWQHRTPYDHRAAPRSRSARDAVSQPNGLRTQSTIRPGSVTTPSDVRKWPPRPSVSAPPRPTVDHCALAGGRRRRHRWRAGAGTDAAQLLSRGWRRRRGRRWRTGPRGRPGWRPAEPPGTRRRWCLAGPGSPWHWRQRWARSRG